MYWSNDKTSKDGCFSSCMQLEKSLLTGWSWSKSGSNLVTRWWHLSKSAIFFGNQWTRAEKKNKNKLLNSAQHCFVFVCVWLFQQKYVCYSNYRRLHLTSLVVLTSSVFLLMDPIRVLTSDRCTSQRTKYSRPSRLSLSFRHGRVSKWWIFASNVWNTVTAHHSRTDS